ncbi:MAG: TetR family transcriptional regulator [Balneolales bacterium]|nr:TetR family transcriptional regulator [Balneolales bacterium]
MSVATTSSKQDLILNAAELLFAEHGFKGTTTRAIAKKAGVNIAMLSYYFGGKEQLLHAVIERFSERLSAVFSDVGQKHTDPIIRLQKWIEAYIDYIFDHPNHARIVYRHVSVSKNKEDIVKLISEFNNVRTIVVDAIEDGINAGYFHPIDAQLAITTIIAPVNAMVLEANVMRHRLNLKEQRGKLYPSEFRERVKLHMIQVYQSLLVV